ncbi:hypothetical protein AALP_AA4G045300 [Arabis alpina]|uniref:Uncharacterized protein n=1 Tax=Arabis alpina TaxID=50452 RepID=A0A087H151_ARAAL|nr:hypothetical protein AALP_AA4G045300 [Arabis alpina]
MQRPRGRPSGSCGGGRLTSRHNQDASSSISRIAYNDFEINDDEGEVRVSIHLQDEQDNSPPPIINHGSENVINNSSENHETEDWVKFVSDIVSDDLDLLLDQASPNYNAAKNEGK